MKNPLSSPLGDIEDEDMELSSGTVVDKDVNAETP
jgi:hypothetical protein